jgi:hypothetical protein
MPFLGLGTLRAALLNMERVLVPSTSREKPIRGYGPTLEDRNWHHRIQARNRALMRPNAAANSYSEGKERLRKIDSLCRDD